MFLGHRFKSGERGKFKMNRMHDGEFGMISELMVWEYVELLKSTGRLVFVQYNMASG